MSKKEKKEKKAKGSEVAEESRNGSRSQKAGRPEEAVGAQPPAEFATRRKSFRP